MAYKYLEKKIPYELEMLIYSYLWEDINKINYKFQGSLFCIEYYGIQTTLGKQIFIKNKLLPIVNYGRGIYEYSKEELTEKNRKETIKMIKELHLNI